MHFKPEHKKLIGTAFNGIVGTISTFLEPKSRGEKIIHHVQEFAEQLNLLRRKNHFNRNLFIGGIAGGLVGAATALLLAPKSGEKLIKGISETLHLNGARREARRKLIKRKVKAVSKRVHAAETRVKKKAKAVKRRVKKAVHHIHATHAV